MVISGIAGLLGAKPAVRVLRGELKSDLHSGESAYSYGADSSG